MPTRYIVFDTETPNCQNARISGIAITVVEDGRIVRRVFSLVNPETTFDYFNIRLTGISPQLVKDKPTFPRLWHVLEPILDSGILIAHNAPFDMRVLSTCLRDYHIPWRQHVAYACTCQMSRRCFPALENHKLNTMCEHLNIPLDHHQVSSDSFACAQLFLKCMEVNPQIETFIKTYDTVQMCTLPKKKPGNKKGGNVI